MSVEITVDLKSPKMRATVSGHIIERHARKLVQDKLKQDTGMAGWFCWNEGDGVNEDGVYVFKLTNDLFNHYRRMAGIID